MTWSYITIHFFDTINWVASLFWLLNIISLILLSFFNLLSEIAESFSITLFLVLFVIPQITLLASLHSLSFMYTNESKFSTTNINLNYILNIFFSKGLLYLNK